mmetsp:Transcript_15543/g.33658  ORF Transcript_15543/g.33658 Transcript_15543/m.33658 type:complete len:955 (-) Transcript_15543:1141-4005(-)|eukprot:CAMPEP_0172297784 /NCGR_PEP_ID=MMETSP1058-20130122/685_1 /TAXON_ID=83371 /ORGANISM="Detonula confervacea, Strain CCMP 353" /LENGTH=954 /DNA_ID=CAMNT_0013006975 /DNA_START=337 /DNA_END=3201 /DNA_ORIENTATION=-
MEATRGGTKHGENGSKKKNETMQQLQNNHHSVDEGSNDENSSVDDTTKIEIPNDDLIVQILARLDGPSYNQALYQDAGSINENFLVPPYFPWHSRTHLPQKMVKTMPRDIDDLHVITHCKDKLHAPFGDFQGPFGFGKYENGQSRGNYSKVPLAETHLLKPGSDASAAARRSQDPGVLELNVQIPLPSSIDAVMNAKDPHTPTPAEKWIAELSKDPDHEEMLSHLPFHWGKRVVCPYSVDKQMNQDSGEQIAHAEPTDRNVELQKLAESRLRSKAQIDLATSCMRKWKISMKVGGVSSRSTLFPSSSVIDTKSEQVPENTRKVIRPMLCLASLPQATQFLGQTEALEMDNAGLAHRLGSYDCRFTDALLNPKRDSVNRAKRIEVGRSRIVWSNLIQGDEPFLPSTRNRVNYNSLITGERFDASKCKRPTEVKVGVRLNGRMMTEEALEDLPTTTTSSVGKRKHSTRQADNEGPALKSCVQCPESRTDEEIDAAFQNNSILRGQKDRVLEQSTENGAVVYLEMGVQSVSPTGIDRNEIIANLLKFNQKKSAQKKLKRSASSDTMSTEAAPMTFGGSQAIKKSNSPRFACVPLEDGLMRTVCLNAGTMVGAAVHQVICEVSEQESGKRCSVCWSDEGSGKKGVLECIKCGLLAHSNCCLDKGEFSTDPEREPLGPQATKRNQRDNTNGATTHINAHTQVDIERSDDQAEQWQCAVCCSYTEMKPRRKPRMPSRFVNGETYTSSNHTGDIDVVNTNANVPGPRCALCPHRGGAMSPLDSSHASGHPHKWAHEVCRVWSGLGISEDSKIKEPSPLFHQFPNGSPLSNVCALCGTGGAKSNKFSASLTRCAARGCFVAFHPMCALLATKVGMDDKAKSVRTRKTRRTEQESDVSENIDADKKYCKEYTLQLVQLTRTERVVSSASEKDRTTIIPVAFCGIHNPRRDDAFYGRLPGGVAV